MSGSNGKPAKPEVEESLEYDKPDPAHYRAFGHPRTKFLTALHLHFNGAEQRRCGKKKVQLQYVEMTSDDDECGLAADGTSFTLVFGKRRLTVHGRNLEKGYDFCSFHRMPFIASADRDFSDGDEPIVTSIVVETVEEPE